MDTVPWPQEIVVKSIEEIVTNTCPKPVGGGVGGGGNLERKPRPQKEQSLNCPRCHSTNTKFCYYNNYSLTQPRYFCKTCRRYWTEGGSLRNIPVGGGSRKNKRSSSSAAAAAAAACTSSPNTNSSSSTIIKSEKLPAHLSSQNPKGQDLNLAFPSQEYFRNMSDHQLVQLSGNNYNLNDHHSHGANSTTNTCTDTTAAASETTTSQSHNFSALELLTGITSSRELSSCFIPLPQIHGPAPVYPAGAAGSFPVLQEFKPTLSFSLDGGDALGSVGSGGGYGIGSLHHINSTPVEESNRNGNGSDHRLSFPFEDLNGVSNTTTTADQNKEQGDSTGYWTGMLGGGSW